MILLRLTVKADYFLTTINMPTQKGRTAMNRPYFDFLTRQLEEAFEKNKTNLSIVRALRAELYHRTRPRALRLRARIDVYSMRFAANARVPGAAPSVVRVPATVPSIVHRAPKLMPKLLPVTPEPVQSRPVASTSIPGSVEARPWTWTWGQRLGIVAVILALIGFFGYSALAAPKKTDRAGTGAVGKTATLPTTAPTRSQDYSDQNEATVYITRTGAKYHQGGCRYLSKSRIPIKLEDAKKHYGPCSVCRPPQ